MGHGHWRLAAWGLVVPTAVAVLAGCSGSGSSGGGTTSVSAAQKALADNRVIVSYDQLVVIVQEHKPGDKITVTYYRGAAKRTATVTLGSA